MLIVLALLLLAQTASAQQRFTPAEQRLKMFQENLAHRAEVITDGSLATVRTLDDWKNSRPKIRQRALYMLGLDPFPAKTPLKARTTGVLDRDGYRVEKVVFQSLPGLYVTGNLYLPKGGASYRRSSTYADTRRGHGARRYSISIMESLSPDMDMSPF